MHRLSPGKSAPPGFPVSATEVGAPPAVPRASVQPPEPVGSPSGHRPLPPAAPPLPRQGQRSPREIRGRRSFGSRRPGQTGMPSAWICVIGRKASHGGRGLRGNRKKNTGFQGAAPGNRGRWVRSPRVAGVQGRREAPQTLSSGRCVHVPALSFCCLKGRKLVPKVSAGRAAPRPLPPNPTRQGGRAGRAHPSALSQQPCAEVGSGCRRAPAPQHCHLLEPGTNSAQSA